MPAAPRCALPCRAAANDKDSGKRLTAANCSSVKVMGFLTQLLMTPYGQPGKARGQGRVQQGSAGHSTQRVWDAHSRAYWGSALPEPPASVAR